MGAWEAPSGGGGGPEKAGEPAREKGPNALQDEVQLEEVEDVEGAQAEAPRSSQILLYLQMGSNDAFVTDQPEYRPSILEPSWQKKWSETIETPKVPFRSRIRRKTGRNSTLW